MFCSDHLGNKYQSIEKMCEYYGIKPATYKYRLSIGLSVEESLTKELKSIVLRKKIVDTEGRTFATVQEMCDFHGVKKDTYYQRLHRGSSKKDALSKRSSNRTNVVKEYNEQLGTDFSNVMEMCKFYGINKNTFYSRIRSNNFTLRQALGIEKKEIQKKVIDHKGNTYISVIEMCKSYGIHKDVYYQRKKLGYTLKECLLGKRDTVVDDKGNTYKSIIEMCDKYNISTSTFYKRRQRGLTLKECLASTQIA